MLTYFTALLERWHLKDVKYKLNEAYKIKNNVMVVNRQIKKKKRETNCKEHVSSVFVLS